MKASKIVILAVFGPMILLAISCQDTQVAEDLKKYQDIDTLEAANIEVVQNFYKLLDEVNLDAVEDLITPDIEIYYQSMKEPANFEDMKPLIEIFYTSFPDYKHSIESVIASGDMVVMRITYSGTHEDTFMEIPPTGNNFVYKGIFMFQLNDNKIMKMWGVEDELTMMRQLGLELQ
jgi:steroid delta-isomerase-like uncharacterized protein